MTSLFLFLALINKLFIDHYLDQSNDPEREREEGRRERKERESGREREEGRREREMRAGETE